MTAHHSSAFLEEIEVDLHDLSQPLTVLQFQLEFGLMADSSAAFQEAIQLSLEQTQRLIEGLERMRNRLLSERTVNTKDSALH